MLLKPKKTKFKKIQNKQNIKQNSYQACYSFINKKVNSNKVIFYSRVPGVLPADQLQAGIRLIQKKLNKKGNVQPLVFPQKPISRKPVGVRIGKGKGAVSFWVCQVNYGQPLFGVPLVAYSVLQDIKKSLNKKLTISVDYKVSTS